MIEEENIGDLKNQEDVNPTSQLDKIVKEEHEQSVPITNGTGSNKPVPTSGSVVIKKEGEANEEEERKG